MNLKEQIKQLEKELAYLEQHPNKDYQVYQAVNRTDEIREYLLPDLYDRLNNDEE